MADGWTPRGALALTGPVPTSWPELRARSRFACLARSMRRIPVFPQMLPSALTKLQACNFPLGQGPGEAHPLLSNSGQNSLPLRVNWDGAWPWRPPLSLLLPLPLGAGRVRGVLVRERALACGAGGGAGLAASVTGFGPLEPEEAPEALA